MWEEEKRKQETDIIIHSSLCHVENGLGLQQRKCREQGSLLSLAVKVTKKLLKSPETTLKASVEPVL